MWDAPGTGETSCRWLGSRRPVRSQLLREVARELEELPPEQVQQRNRSGGDTADEDRQPPDTDGGKLAIAVRSLGDLGRAHVALDGPLEAVDGVRHRGGPVQGSQPDSRVTE